jgi:hypothetical protein
MIRWPVAVADTHGFASAEVMMTDGAIPWTEHAVAVLRSQETVGDTSILFEGPLLQVVGSLLRARRRDVRHVRVSLPDRCVAPRSFDGAALLALMDLGSTLQRSKAGICPKVGF